MIEKDMTWNNDHHQQAIRDLIILQQKLFNERLKERNTMKKIQTIRMIWNKKNRKIGKTW